jgi:hypothetical protein
MGVKQKCTAVGLKFDFVATSGDENRVTASQIVVGIIRSNGGAAVERGENVEAIVIGELVRLAKPQAVEDEFVTGDEALDVRTIGGQRFDRVYGAAREVDCFECLRDVERAWFAVGVDAIPITKAEGGIAGLLDFGNEESRSESMHRAGFDEQAVASDRLKLMQK